jgi:hypothetical protein
MAAQDQARQALEQPDNGHVAPGQPQGGIFNAVVKLVLMYAFFMYMRSGKKSTEAGSDQRNALVSVEAQ